MKLKWPDVRKKLVPLFEEAGIAFCEIGRLNLTDSKGNKVCNGMFIAFAHSKKGRHRTSESDMEEVALACSGCHSHIEYSMSEDEMASLVKQAIDARSVKIRSIFNE